MFHLSELGKGGRRCRLPFLLFMRTGRQLTASPAASDCTPRLRVPSLPSASAA